MKSHLDYVWKALVRRQYVTYLLVNIQICVRSISPQDIHVNHHVLKPLVCVKWEGCVCACVCACVRACVRLCVRAYLCLSLARSHWVCPCHYLFKSVCLSLSPEGRDIAQTVEPCKGWDHPIEPARQVHLQFGIFFITTSGMVRAVLSVGKCISLVAY